jgi:hypothetical protein
MTRSGALAVVVGVLGAAVGAAVLSPPIPQDPAYHRMADTRTFAGVPNALNVLSNAAFVLVGVAGLRVVRGDAAAVFVDARERWPWRVFFAGLAVTGVGSAYYHLAPANDRLVWDRLPLAASLMGLFAAVIAERIGVRAGLLALPVLIAAALGSVIWWHVTESQGRGDLRPYALVQFYPLVAVPAMLWLCTPRYTIGTALIAAVAVYAAAKGFESVDGPVLQLGSVVSGHTLKHLVAAAAGAVIAWMLRARRPCPAADGEAR